MTSSLYTQITPLFLRKSQPPPRIHHWADLAMPLDHTIQHITSNQNSFIFNRKVESLSIDERHSSINPLAMAEERKNGNVSPGDDTTLLNVSKSAD